MMEGITPTIKWANIDIEKTFAAPILNIANKLIRAASLVPRPFILIGIIETRVPKGIIAR